MNRAPSIIASISIAVAALAVGPFGQAGGSDMIPVSHSADGVALTGAIGLQDPNDSHDVSCGESLVADATDVITTDADFGGTVAHAGQTLTARTDEAQFVQRGGIVVCIDADGPLLDDNGVVVAHWHLRPGGDGTQELHIGE